MTIFNRKVLILILVATIINSSCSNDNGLNTDHIQTECIIESIPEDFSSISCEESPVDTSIYCEIILVDKVFELTVDERKWIPYYCCELGEKIYFEDIEGNETGFVLEEKNRGIYTAGFNGFDDCDSLNEKHRVYCVNREVISIEFYSDLLRHELGIKLEVEFDRPFELPLETGVILEIRGNKINHLTAFVEEGDLNDINAENLIYHDEFELLGENFSNVHTYRNVVDNDFVEIFYNKEFGLIGFKDYNETLWKMKN